MDTITVTTADAGRKLRSPAGALYTVDPSGIADAGGPEPRWRSIEGPFFPCALPPGWCWVELPDLAPVVTLRDWRCTGDPRQGYTAPEALPPVLHGEVYGHPRMPDGARICTTHVVGYSGRTVETASGTRYQLGEPSPAFTRWLQERGTPLDPLVPVPVGRCLDSDGETTP